MKKYKRIMQYMPVDNLAPMQTTESVITEEELNHLQNIAKADQYGCVKQCDDYLYIKYGGYGTYRNYITEI